MYIYIYIYIYKRVLIIINKFGTSIAALEDAIHLLFLPSLTGRDAPTDDERELLALPAHLGGLGLVSPTTLTKEYDNSLHLSALITLQSADLGDTREKQREVKATLRAERRRQQETTAAELKARLPSHLQSAADHASEKGSSSWVTALPIADHGFTLHKGDFRDALCLRYNWTLPHLPTSCVCGAGLTVEHALTYLTGGYTFIRHNEIRDNLAKLLTEVCHDVCIEPYLQPLSSESFTARSVITGDSARLDVAASGFWGGRFERTFDVRVFNTHAPSNRSPQLATTYRRHEREKRLHYEQRVLEVEHASFVPFVMSCTGGAGPCATVVLKRLGALLDEKHNSSYSTVMGLLHCRLNFALLRASVMCLRDSRSSF